MALWSAYPLSIAPDSPSPTRGAQATAECVKSPCIDFAFTQMSDTNSRGLCEHNPRTDLISSLEPDCQRLVAIGKSVARDDSVSVLVLQELRQQIARIRDMATASKLPDIVSAAQVLEDAAVASSLTRTRACRDLTLNALGRLLRKLGRS